MNDTSDPYVTLASASQPTQVVPSVTGDYDFRIGDVINGAWAKIKDVKGTLTDTPVVYSVMIQAIAPIFILPFGGTDLMNGANPITLAVGQMVASPVAIVVGYPFSIGLTMVGTHHAAGQPATFNEMFNYFGVLASLLFIDLLTVLMVYIGSLLLIIPGLHPSTVYVLVLPLMAERGLTSWQTLETPRKVISRHWFKVFGLLLVLSLLTLVSMIPLFISLIRTGPLFVASMGTPYRTIFGVRPLGS